MYVYIYIYIYIYHAFLAASPLGEAMLTPNPNTNVHNALKIS